MKPMPPLLWYDMETTGLVPETHQPLELALVATDENLEIEHEVSLVIPWNLSNLIWDEFAKKMHESNKLIADVKMGHDYLKERKPSIEYPAEIEGQLIDWVYSKGLENRPMAGSSVQFDRNFSSEWFTGLLEAFHYRNFDVRTLRTWYGIDKPKTNHRALDDLHADIATVKELRSQL